MHLSHAAATSAKHCTACIVYSAVVLLLQRANKAERGYTPVCSMIAASG
jgi:hypothetical protein